jgi:hypothetical protein
MVSRVSRYFDATGVDDPRIEKLERDAQYLRASLADEQRLAQKERYAAFLFGAAFGVICTVVAVLAFF